MSCPRCLSAVRSASSGVYHAPGALRGPHKACTCGRSPNACARANVKTLSGCTHYPKHPGLDRIPRFIVPLFSSAMTSASRPCSSLRNSVVDVEIYDTSPPALVTKSKPLCTTTSSPARTHRVRSSHCIPTFSSLCRTNAKGQRLPIVPLGVSQYPADLPSPPASV